MSTALVKSLDRNTAVAKSFREAAMMLKASGQLGGMLTASSQGAFFEGYRDIQRGRENYASFRNWTYSAVNAIAAECAGQPCSLARLTDQDEEKKPDGKKLRLVKTMGPSARTKAAEQELDVLIDHPVIECLEHPNEMQHRWQFTYSFVASLMLTGWSYVVYDVDKEGRLRLYAIPSTWVTPIHDKGPFSSFKICDPKNPSAGQNDKPLTRDNVAFAYLPDPANPLAALAPASTQMPAIRIDDYIQASQEQHFQNGIFPSVIVTIGKQPHPEVPGGMRPRLTASQRRQVHLAISKAMSGVANYGSPAIVDGMVESITKFTNSEPEMGWARSEDKVRTRILSAFGVHPYILGEPVGVGGYAQCAKIEERFCKRVNTCLDMLSNLVTGIINGMESDDGEKKNELVVWWEEAKPHDPGLRWQGVQFARNQGDISQNELRAELGFPPDEDNNESVVSPQQTGAIIQLLAQIGAGAVQQDQGKALLIAMGLPDKVAKDIIGKPLPPKPEPPVAPPGAFQPGQPGQPGQQPPPPRPKPENDREAVEQAVEEVQKAVYALKQPLRFDIGDVMESVYAS